MSFSDAYVLGQQAHDRGDEFEMNPYDQLDTQADEWDFGWIDAYTDSK